MIGLYIRESRQRQGSEDKDNTIANQRLVLKDFLKKNLMQGLPYDEYIDYPYSGMNFKRPEWRRLIEDCKTKRIDTVIAKGMSRLGRNYIELNEYLDDIFPLLGIRVITVEEGYDSKKQVERGSDEDLFIKAQNIMNTFFVKDIAVKMMTAKRARWKKGLQTSGNAPYGYICDGAREGWRTDEEAAEVVKRIFELRLEGKRQTEIAEILNRENVPTPTMHKAEIGKHKPVEEGRVLLWSGSAVSNILYNEQYTGVLIQGKQICVSPGLGKMKTVDEEDWFRTEGHHETLVSEEDFLKVMEMKPVPKTGEKKKPRERQDYYFRSLLRCGNCGRLLAHQGNRYSCILGRQSEFSGCRSESYDEDELKVRVWRIIREKQAQAQKKLEESVDLDVTGIEAKVEALKTERKATYRKYTEGKISLEENMAVKDRVGKELAGLEEEIVRRNVQKMDYYRMVQALEQLVRAKDETVENFRRIVEAVYVDGDEIRVELKADQWLQQP